MMTERLMIEESVIKAAVMQLIILTCQDDLHADAVISRLDELGTALKVVRINTDNFSSNIDYSFNWTTRARLKEQSLRLNDSNVSIDSPSVIWYRKPDKPSAYPVLTDQNAIECSAAEYRELLRSFEGIFFKAKWLNDYWQMQRFSIKANQIPIAEAVGFNIPETVISNSLKVVKSLADRYPDIIVKPMSYSGFAEGSSQYGCYTNIVTANDLTSWSDEILSYAPAIYQQRINKAQELRVTVVGQEIFACEIKTQVGTSANIDWRIQDVENLEHRIVDLPGDVSKRLLAMMDRMGLNFGAFDLIKDETGTYYFIEVNPNGQYYWIELLTGAPITEAIVSLIIRLSDSVETNQLCHPKSSTEPSF